MTDLAQKDYNPVTVFERLKKCETPTTAAVLLQRVFRGNCPPQRGVCRADDCLNCWFVWLNSPLNMPPPSK